MRVYLRRPPRGEWVGLAESVLHDAGGVIGTAVQALLVGPR